MSKILKLFFVILYLLLILVNALFASRSYNAGNYIAACLSFASCIIAIGGFHYFINKILFRKPPNITGTGTVSMAIRFTGEGRRDRLLLAYIRRKGKGTECIVNSRKMATPLILQALGFVVASIGEQEGFEKEAKEVLNQLSALGEKVREKQQAEPEKVREANKER